ncbi:MAG: PBECR2 nuclease fold domain-containing protein [Paracoccus sp. (in: a-proteobacteria)]
MGGMHDRAFVVAGAADLSMLEEFQAAIIEGAQNYDIKTFGAEFDRIVDKYGWGYNGGRDWRVRTIFETNIRTSHMAGRLKQMRDPEMVRAMPYWQYIHAETRIPLNPRLQHVDWDGLVLRWDDSWWDVHFPPNDWKCSCGVRALSEAQLKRLGRTGPDQAPEIIRQFYTHEASGETVQLPEGVGYGWDYMPGDLWERGLVPSALLDDPLTPTTFDPKGRNLVEIDQAGPMADLLARARPFESKVMDPGLPVEDYVGGFLDVFGLNLGEARLWEDSAGGRVLISDQLFREASGKWKGVKRGHGDHAPLLAEAMRDPDEIWLGVREVPIEGFPDEVELMLTRRYIRVDPETALQAVFEMGRRHWQGVTGYGSYNRAKPDYSHINKQRVGKLIWKRK